MMIKPISHYDAKRKTKHRRGYEDFPREANGRVRRSATKSLYMVYFVRVEGNPLLKVGRTRDMASRIKTYEESNGRVARCVAQFVVRNFHDSVRLETAAIAYLAKRYTQTRREWFAVPESHDPEMIEAIRTQCGTLVQEQRGLPGKLDEEKPLIVEAGEAARALVRQYESKRGRIRL